MADDRPSISLETIRNLARLSRLDVGEEDIERLRVEVGEILATIAHLQSVDVSGVEPTLHPVELDGTGRADEVDDALDKQAFLELAPESNEDGVVVPRVVG